MPDAAATLEVVIRWIHFLAGITWIGLLYFFNLVNVPLMKALDAPTKGKVVPQLMPRALWWFRHAAWVTVLAGFVYYAFLIVPGDAAHDTAHVVGVFVVVTCLAWLVMWAIIKKIDWKVGQGKILAVVLGVLVLVHFALILTLCGGPGHSSRALSIGLGGGLGVMMMLNVWMIIWPNNRRVIDWTRENADKGTPIPPEAAGLARKAFLASRTNAWLSLPMLFLMASASHYPFLAAFTN